MNVACLSWNLVLCVLSKQVFYVSVCITAFNGTKESTECPLRAEDKTKLWALENLLLDEVFLLIASIIHSNCASVNNCMQIKLASIFKAEYMVLAQTIKLMCISFLTVLNAHIYFKNKWVILLIKTVDRSCINTSELVVFLPSKIKKL